MSKAQEFLKEFKEAADPDLYISCSTGIAQAGGGSERGRVYSVIYQGQAMSASKAGYKDAVDIANKISKQTGAKVAYWDGDKGKFVSSLKESVSSWRELSKMDHPNTGDTYTIWVTSDSESKKPVYQVTKGNKPSGDSGYYNLSSLLKLKGL
jgi:hypothetical protein